MGDVFLQFCKEALNNLRGVLIECAEPSAAIIFMAEAPPRNPQPGLDWPLKRRVTLVGAAGNVVLAIGKFAAGIFGNSQALIVDAVHTVSDLISDVVVLVAARWGAHEADHNHPYGHGRIETVATALIGFLLLAVAIGFIVDGIARLNDPERLLQPGWIALSAAVISVAVKEGLYWYTRRVARRTRSELLMANAWHHRSDAMSSVVVIVGILGAIGGLLWLDAVAAILVAVMVGHIGIKFVFRALTELVDTAVPADTQRELEALIMTVDGVRGFRDLRTRTMGGQTVMDVRILLDPELSLAEADQLARRVRRCLLSASVDVFDVVVSIAPVPPASEMQ